MIARVCIRAFWCSLVFVCGICLHLFACVDVCLVARALACPGCSRASDFERPCGFGCVEESKLNQADFGVISQNVGIRQYFCLCVFTDFARTNPRQLGSSAS